MINKPIKIKAQLTRLDDYQLQTNHSSNNNIKNNNNNMNINVRSKQPIRVISSSSSSSSNPTSHHPSTTKRTTITSALTPRVTINPHTTQAIKAIHPSHLSYSPSLPSTSPSSSSPSSSTFPSSSLPHPSHQSSQHLHHSSSSSSTIKRSPFLLQSSSKSSINSSLASTSPHHHLNPRSSPNHHHTDTLSTSSDLGCSTNCHPPPKLSIPNDLLNHHKSTTSNPSAHYLHNPSPSTLQSNSISHLRSIDANPSLSSSVRLASNRLQSRSISISSSSSLSSSLSHSSSHPRDQPQNNLLNHPNLTKPTRSDHHPSLTTSAARPMKSSPSEHPANHNPTHQHHEVASTSPDSSSKLSTDNSNRNKTDSNRPLPSSLLPHQSSHSTPNPLPNNSYLSEEHDTARVNRKLLDLEISNASLLAINGALERTKVKQQNEIRELKKKLKAQLHHQHESGEEASDESGSTLLNCDSDPTKSIIKGKEQSHDHGDTAEGESNEMSLEVLMESDHQFGDLVKSIDSLIQNANRAIQYKPNLSKNSSSVVSTPPISQKFENSRADHHHPTLNPTDLPNPNLNLTDANPASSITATTATVGKTKVLNPLEIEQKMYLLSASPILHPYREEEEEEEDSLD